MVSSQSGEKDSDCAQNKARLMTAIEKSCEQGLCDVR